MSCRSITLFNFRNIANDSIAFPARQIFFVGTNGQGKTNLLEAIYTLCYGASFRTRHDREICRHNEREMSLQGTFLVAEEEIKIQYRWRGEKKSIHLNEKMVADRGAIISLSPSIIFSHKDIRFVSGEAKEKRFFYDQLACLSEPTYIDTLRRYKRVLKSRNAALITSSEEVIDSLDEQLAEVGTRMCAIRLRYAEMVQRIVATTYEEIAGDGSNIGIEYRPSWRSQDPRQVCQELRNLRSRDRDTTMTTSGPHRDRFLYVLNGRRMETVASTGQIRLLSLILRAAQATIFTQHTGALPLLLLDDVLLELDSRRRSGFLERLPAFEQALFTFLPDEHYENYGTMDYLVYRVNNGAVTEDTTRR